MVVKKVPELQVFKELSSAPYHPFLVPMVWPLLVAKGFLRPHAERGQLPGARPCREPLCWRAALNAPSKRGGAFSSSRSGHGAFEMTAKPFHCVSSWQDINSSGMMGRAGLSPLQKQSNVLHCWHAQHVGKVNVKKNMQTLKLWGFFSSTF